MGQHKYAYKIYDKDGNISDFQKMLDSSLKSDIILFGELHNNPISHWLQISLTKEIYAKKSDKLILGAEMFETDNQLILNEYLQGKITERNFKAEAKMWNNYDTDYKPLVEFAKNNNIPFVGTNIPRRYAALVHRQGFDALLGLEYDAMKYLPPLPVPYDAELPSYKTMLEMQGMPAHSNENLPKAQAIKDATMAHFILKNFSQGKVFLHFHGAYHSDNYEGIFWYLTQYGKKDNLITITTVEQDNLNELHELNKGKADFIIVVDPDMTKTY
ncbi:MAG: ChaN family lipoprotein [Bacteroidetes bacterium]|nr:ChaN family lipoprotein [Bacteroidota bacterium]